MMSFRYRSTPSWPPLAWCARCGDASGGIDVFHGANVETSTDWFCEAVWDQPYENGDFDLTDIVFGSGGRIRDGHIRFVTSGSTVDRLHSLTTGTVTTISNSLPCILAVSGARLPLEYSGYFDDFESIQYGLRRYMPFVHTSMGPVRLTYFHNLLLTSNGVEVDEKRRIVRDFSSFSRYRECIDNAIGSIAANMASTSRSRTYSMLGTISTGYDSPTVATLCVAHGLSEAVTFDRSKHDESDSGSEIARHLGVRLHEIPRRTWQEDTFVDVPFIVGNARGQDVFFAGAHEHLSDRVLMTGFHGDKVWDLHTTRLSDDIVRGDPSGLSLCEYRLHAGFIHCPVPFIGVRQIRDINRISRLPEMAEWSVPGDYNRPICRRIVESAGIGRGLFGTTKKAGAVQFFKRSIALAPATSDAFGLWLTEHRRDLRINRCLPFSFADNRCFNALQIGAAASGCWLARRSLNLKPYQWFTRKLEGFGNKDYRFRQIYPWAVEMATRRYPTDTLDDGG